MRALGGVGDLGERALGLAAGVAERLRRGAGVGREGGGELLHARFERLGDLAGALLDLAGDRLGAAEPQVLEVGEDLVQRASRPRR